MAEAADCRIRSVDTVRALFAADKQSALTVELLDAGPRKLGRDLAEAGGGSALVER